MNNHHLAEPVSILMPVCNEVDRIEQVFQEWHQEVFQYLPAGSEVIVEDGASTDGTIEILKSLMNEMPLLRVSFHPSRDGFGRAALRLYRSARCPWVFFTDGDGQYAPTDFWRVARLMDTHHFIHGIKGKRHDPWYRLLASFCFNTIVRIFFQTKHSDINSAYRLLRREILMKELPKLRHLHTLVNAELLLRCEKSGVAIQDIAVEHRPRISGKSRGLPVNRFILESASALWGIIALRWELARMNSQ